GALSKSISISWKGEYNRSRFLEICMIGSWKRWLLPSNFSIDLIFVQNREYAMEDTANTMVSVKPFSVELWGEEIRIPLEEHLASKRSFPAFTFVRRAALEDILTIENLGRIRIVLAKSVRLPEISGMVSFPHLGCNLFYLFSCSGSDLFRC
ncbi:unnamed protein product, partial [Ilex paraguariensis]